jgi:hypothetical protein
MQVMKARIYQPAKTAMQSGRANTRRWVLESVPEKGKLRDPLMGWTGSADMDRQWRLRFDNKAEAIAYAERRGIDYVVEAPHPRTLRPKSYAANFRWDRPE